MLPHLPASLWDMATLTNSEPDLHLSSYSRTRPIQVGTAPSAGNGGSSKTLPGLLRIPLEVRWQIFRELLSASKYSICPHNRLPFVVFYLRKFNSVVNEGAKHGLSALLLNRQIYHEMMTLLYSENFFYFERCFTWPGNPLPYILTRSAGSYLHHIGFSVDQKIQKFAAPMDAVQGEMDRLRRLCLSLKHFAPNLKVVRFYLFCSPKPEAWFLLKLVDYANYLPGKKMIIVQGSNRKKYRIAGILKESINVSANFLLLGGCICSPFTPPPGNWFSSPQTRPVSDTLSRWVSLYSPWRQSVKLNGSVPYSVKSYKGPLTACLICQNGVECIHDAQYSPKRLRCANRKRWVQANHELS